MSRKPYLPGKKNGLEKRYDDPNVPVPDKSQVFTCEQCGGKYLANTEDSHRIVFGHRPGEES